MRSSLFPKPLRRALAAAAWLGLASAALANPYEKTLSNGLKIIVKEDRRAPSVVHMVWYKVGAIDEVEGTSGVAHVLEHMMFKGTRKLGPGEFSKRVAAAGGRDNAFTSLDYTAYFQQVPKQKLGEMMGLEADRMANLRLTDGEFAKEIKVVMEERRLRTEDQPRALVYEALSGAAFQSHPYRRPIIGWMKDLENMTPEDARQWYRQWYAPNNAALVVVGDVDHNEVFRMAQQHYGPVASKALPTRKPLADAPQLGIRRVVVGAPAEMPYLIMAYKVPALRDVAGDREPYALEVLAGVLSGNDAARLPKNLVRAQRVADSASAGYDMTSRGEVLFLLDGSPAQGQSVNALEAALRAELMRVQQEGVSEEELNRVKTRIVASEVFKRDSLFGQARELGNAFVLGFRPQDLDVMVEKLRSVTAAEVQAVARKYFSDRSLTVAVLEPLPADGKPPRAMPVGGRH